MRARLEAQKVSQSVDQAVLGLEMFVRKQSKLEPALIQLVKMRASQINGCAALALREAITLVREGCSRRYV